MEEYQSQYCGRILVDSNLFNWKAVPKTIYRLGLGRIRVSRPNILLKTRGATLMSNSGYIVTIYGLTLVIANNRVYKTIKDGLTINYIYGIPVEEFQIA